MPVSWLANPGSTAVGLHEVVRNLTTLLIAIVAAGGTWLVQKTSSGTSRENRILDSAENMRNDLARRVEVLEADRDRLTTEVSDLQNARVYDSYVRAYARLLVERWPRPPDPPPAPPIVAELLAAVEPVNPPRRRSDDVDIMARDPPAED